MTERVLESKGTEALVEVLMQEGNPYHKKSGPGGGQFTSGPGGGPVAVAKRKEKAAKAIKKSQSMFGQPSKTKQPMAGGSVVVAKRKTKAAKLLRKSQIMFGG